MEKHGPIFIIGTERSGSNLLRSILTSHSNIAIPHPPHLIDDFFKYHHLYGDLEKDVNFKQLLEDMVAHVRWHHHPWGIDFNTAAIFSKCRTRSVLSIFEQIYKEYCHGKGKKRWGCKSLAIIHCMDMVRKHFPDCKFIHLVRDCRDSALSFKKVFFKRRNHVYFTADRWRCEQNIAWNFTNNELAPAQILTVKYEELLKDTESIVRKICSFIEEPFEQGMLNYFRQKETVESASLSALWKNIDAPIKRDNMQKYRNGLTPVEIRLIEKVAGEEMVHFGYTLDYPDREGSSREGRSSIPPLRLAGIFMRSYGAYLINMISNLHQYDEIYRRGRKRVMYSWTIFRRWISHKRAFLK